MLFRKHIVSSRTLFQLTLALVFFMLAAVGAADAANTGNPPLLVPTQIVTVAGVTQYNASNAQVGGFSGDGASAVETLDPTGSALGYKGAKAMGGAALNSPSDIAVDAVGNLYIADTQNDIIREVNYATGVINTIAGVAPTGCSGTTCTVHYSGCANGVPAYGTPIGLTPYAVAVDSFGNVYYADYKGTTSVIYRGGTRVADFIARVNPGAVAKSGGVKVGYIYFIAGTINTATCNITSSPTVNNGPAFTDSSNPNAVAGVTDNNTDYITLDSAGNIYLSMGNDASNSSTSTAWTVVINTQETPQTFFQYTVQPGYMAQIVNCHSGTTGPCQVPVSGTIEGIGIDGPISGLTFGGNQYIGGQVDGYGNLYQNMGNGSGTGTPGAGFTPVAYAGGPGMTNYLTARAPIETAAGYSPTQTVVAIPSTDTLVPSMLPLTYGNVYHVSISGAVRPSSWDADMYGTMYFMDSNQPLLERIDQFQGDFIVLASGSALTGRPTTVPTLKQVSNLNGTTSDYTSVASFANPWNCMYGGSPTDAWIQGPQSYDPRGDNCYGQNANTSNYLRFNFVSDSIPNLIFGDYGRNEVREDNVGTQFPTRQNPFITSIPVGTTLTQWIQVHFDSSNPPLTGAGASSGTFTSQSVQVPGTNVTYTTNAFSVAPGSDFTLDTTTSEFAMDTNTLRNYGSGPNEHNTAWAGLPTCSQINLTFPDTSYDCLAFVQFAPTQPGLRTGTMVVTTANGSVYNFQLTGQASGPQLAIDGGAQATVTYTGLTTALGPTSSIAVAPSASGTAGNLFIADPTHNRIVVQPATGSVTTIGPTLTVVYPGNFTGTPVQTLSNPQGVALDAAGNLYISDTGNKRVLEYNRYTAIATVLGNYVWVPGAACDGGTTSPTVKVNCTFTNYTTNTLASAKSESILNEPGAAAVATVGPPQYQWGQPLGLAVDAWGNVYVADGGNASANPAIPPAIVMIPANLSLGGATPLLQYPGAPTFTTPVAVAVDAKGFIYVADSSNVAGEVSRIPPGGGDMQPAGTSFPGSALNVVTTLPLFGGQGINNPNGVAVDAAGDVFVSDSSGNAVWEAPAAGPPNGIPFALSFTGLSSPAGLALDASGNLYVADSGNKQILVMGRQNPSVPFGTVPQDLGLSGTTGTPIASGVAGTPAGCPVLGSGVPCTGVLTVTNTGTTPATLSSPFLGLIGNPQFSISHNCTSPLPVGTTCTITPLFTPTSNGQVSVAVSVNGTQSLNMLAGTGANPQVKIVLIPSNGTGTSPNYTVTAPGAETITATVSQPHVVGAPTPTGTVAFSYAIDAGTPNAGLCGAPGTSGPVTLVAGVASYTIPGGLAAGQSYTVTAVFTPGGSDTTDSITNAQTPILITVAPTTAESVTATSVTFMYGTAVPALTGTVTPALPTGVTVAYTSGASRYSAVGTYPIQAVFSGTNFCTFGSPVAYSSGTTPATVTETKAAMAAVVPPYSTVYGAASFNYASGMVITGAVGNDLPKLSATFTPIDSSVLDVRSFTGTTTSGSATVTAVSTIVGPLTVGETVTGAGIPTGTTIASMSIASGTGTVTLSQSATASATAILIEGSYPVLATMTGKPIGNYSLTIANGTDTVTPAPVGVGITPAKSTAASSSLGIGTQGVVINTPAGVASATFAISVGTQVTAGKGTTSGSVLVYDTFVPITLTNFIATPLTGVFPMANGVIQWPSSAIMPCAVGAAASAACTPVTSVPVVGGSASFVTPPYVSGTASPYYTSAGAVVPGTHYFSFLYSGDAGANGDGLGDFACSVVGQAATQLPSSLGIAQLCTSTGSVPFALVVDYPDFTFTPLNSNTAAINVYRGTPPSGSGLPSVPGQNGSYPGSTLLALGGINSFVGTINLTCTAQHPSYETCFAGQITVVNGAPSLISQATITLSLPTVTIVFDIQTPATLPIGFNLGTTSQLRTAATRTVLAFLPLGVLAFCVRRRRRLSKALWMLIAIAAVGTVMSGCGGTNVQFYTPIPTGPETVTVNATYTSITAGQPTTTRSYAVPIIIN